MNAKTKTVLLGSLEVGDTFTFPRRKTVYKTIDHRPSVNPWYGSRYCYNTRTRKAELVKCNENVSKEAPPELGT